MKTKTLTFTMIILGISGIVYSWAIIISSGLTRAKIEYIEELCYILIVGIILSYLGIKRINNEN